MWIEAFWTSLHNIFQVFETMCYQFFSKEHASRTSPRNIIGRNPSIVIPLLANQDFTTMLYEWALRLHENRWNRSTWNRYPCPFETFLFGSSVNGEERGYFCFGIETNER